MARAVGRVVDKQTGVPIELFGIRAREYRAPRGDFRGRGGQLALS